MLTLHELQSEFGRFLAGEHPQQLLQMVDGAGFDGESRLSIYRNNTVATLTATLKATFPVTCRLVGERFFDYAANTFIQHNLPASACLVEYGGDFPHFLVGFGPAASVVYLADVARLEWSINRVLHAPNTETPIALESLVTITGDPAQCRLHMAAATEYLASAYPIERIWQLHQPGIDPADLALEGSGVHLEIRRADGLMIAGMTPASWTFRSRIRSDATLGSAAEAAFAIAPDFDLASALAELFGAGLVVGLG